MTDTDDTPPHPQPTLIDVRELHDQAVADAEAHRISHALAPYGILSGDQLREHCGAGSWQQGSFEHALGKAVAAGLVEALPGGFYRDVVHLGRAVHDAPPATGEAPPATEAPPPA